MLRRKSDRKDLFELSFRPFLWINGIQGSNSPMPILDHIGFEKSKDILDLSLQRI